jgi:hypothetical protein
MSRLLLLLILSSSTWAGEAVPIPEPKPAVPLPPTVQAALTKYQEAVALAERDAFVRKQKAQAEVLKFLDKTQSDAVKAGNLDLAMALREQRAAVVQENEGDLLTASSEPLVPTTAVQWDHLSGKVVTVTANQVLELGDIPATAAFRLVPHPTDVWKASNADTAVGYLGRAGSLSINLLPQMALLVANEGRDAVVNPTTVYRGGVKMSLRANDIFMADNVDSIRVKIVPAKP